MYQNIFIDRETDGRQTVYIWDDNKGLVTLPFSQFSYAFVPDKNGNMISMTGVRVSKKYRYPKDATVFESDVPKETRVITDLYLNEDTPSTGHTVLFFDIEVSMENGIPDKNNPNNKITSIAARDSVTNEDVIFVLDEQNKQPTINGVTIHCFDDEIDLLRAFVEYFEQVRPTIITGWNIDQFDTPYLYNRVRQMCGPAIASRFSPIGKVKFSEFRNRYVIAGVASLDYMDMYKKFTYTQQPSYRLDAIAQFELNESKVAYHGSLDDLYNNDLQTFIEYNLQDVKIVAGLDKKLKLIELVRGICHVGHVPYEDYCYSSRFLEGTIITYLHRKGIVCTNKPEGGREKFEQQREEDSEGFSGAFVKVPMPGLYEWIYSLDLQSLYPSIIMSLNISPETKKGVVTNWNQQDYQSGKLTSFIVREGDGSGTRLTRDQFDKYMQETKYMISSNGVLYSSEKIGVIPEVLDVWFAQRKEFKGLVKKYLDEGNKEMADFYDQRQHIQKIFLNSLYGVLGLPIFRFYDVDNALAVTASGQDVIKNSAQYVNSLYAEKKVEARSPEWLRRYHEVLKDDAKRRKQNVPAYPSEFDHCVYIDTDSLYFSSNPFLTKMTIDDEKKQFTIKLAKAVEKKLNAYYDVLAKEHFFCETHRFVIKGESVARSGIWIAKKRYAMDKIYDLETNKDVEKLVVKGLDVVRSSFPKAFKEFMKNLLKVILKGTSKGEVDGLVLEFRESMEKTNFMEIARNTAIKNISEYEIPNDDILTSFMKGTPAHVKAGITYNRLLKHYGIDHKYERIEDGAKIKYVYLKDNPLNIETVAVKGYNDPDEILELINEYIDCKALFDNELKNKLEDFYSALGWGILPTEVNQAAANFFAF